MDTSSTAISKHALREMGSIFSSGNKAAVWYLYYERYPYGNSSCSSTAAAVAAAAAAEVVVIEFVILSATGRKAEDA